MVVIDESHLQSALRLAEIPYLEPRFRSDLRPPPRHRAAIAI